MAMSRLYADLAAHPVFQNNLTSLPKVGAVDVEISLCPVQVMKVEDANQKIVTAFQFDVTWVDDDLAWSEQHYANISNVRIPVNSLWHPVIITVNDASSFNEVPYPDMATLYSTGQIRIEAGVFIQSYCAFDMTNFPFDSQTCRILFIAAGMGPQIQTTFLLKNESLFMKEKDFDFLLLKGEWMIEDRSLITKVLYLDTAFEVRIRIRRANLYYILFLLVPLISTMLLTLLVFWIPPESGENISYLVSIYMSTSLFLGLIGDNLPKNMSSEDNVPKLTMFLVFVIIECIVALMATVCVMRRHKQEMDQICLNYEPAFNSVMYHTMAPKSYTLFLVLLNWADVDLHFLKEMDPARMAMSRLYADLAAHPVFQNNLTSLPKVGTVDVKIELYPMQ
ncbi:acetylcholine receptor subunit beta-like 1, partial [Physella acuta]|uniref:acetylcholine receptor subunit beta-like 1 n=1 Tax=Physella acuta TaxID=109671 RepID=UPI0027DBB1C2